MTYNEQRLKMLGKNEPLSIEEDAFYWMLLLDLHQRSFFWFPKISADIIEITLAKVREANGVFDYDDPVDQYVIRIDGEEVGWARSQQAAWNMYNDMLRVRREHNG